MIKWAYRLRMEGRKYAVEALRLLLFYLILNDQHLRDYLERLEVLTPNKRSLAQAVGIIEWRMYRAIKSLLVAGIVERKKCCPRRLYINITTN